MTMSLSVSRFTGLISSIASYTKISPNAKGRNPDGEKRKIRISVVGSSLAAGLLSCNSIKCKQPKVSSTSSTRVTLYLVDLLETVHLHWAGATVLKQPQWRVATILRKHCWNQHKTQAARCFQNLEAQH
jgi:hypothetical protein